MPRPSIADPAKPEAYMTESREEVLQLHRTLVARLSRAVSTLFQTMSLFTRILVSTNTTTITQTRSNHEIKEKAKKENLIIHACVSLRRIQMMLRTPSTESAADQDVEVSSGIEVVPHDSVEDLDMYLGSVGILRGLDPFLVGGEEGERCLGHLIGRSGPD